MFEIKYFLRLIWLKFEWLTIFEARWSTDFFYFILSKLSICKECLDGYIFPYVGLPPHKSIFVTPINLITISLPKRTWDNNVIEEEDGMCTYYCPNSKCVYYKDNYAGTL